MSRTFCLFCLLLLSISAVVFATQSSKRYFLSSDQTSIEEQVTEKRSSPILTLDELTDSVPAFYPHVAGQKLVNKKFHMVSVSPDDKHIAFVSGETDQWLGTIDAEARTYKFILFGVSTSFIDALWTPDSRYLAYAFKGPDRRIVVHVIGPPPPGENKPIPMNYWFYNTTKNEDLRVSGWQVAGKDTSLAFELLDARGKVQEAVTLPLHRQEQLGPLKSQGK